MHKRSSMRTSLPRLEMGFIPPTWDRNRCDYSLLFVRPNVGASTETFNYMLSGIWYPVHHQPTEAIMTQLANESITYWNNLL